MAVLAGFTGQVPLGGVINPWLSVEHHQFAGEAWWPPSDGVVPPAMVGGLVTHWPVAANGQEIPGWRTMSYHDDFYYRLHLIPRQLDVGNVATTQVATVVIWNAHLTPKNLSDLIPVGAEGITVDGPYLPVSTVPALKEAEYQVAITPDGPPVVDATLTWRFDGDPDVVLPITATRIIPWPWVPDWTNGVRESLEWLTDVLQSPTADEQRRALRPAPRRFVEADIVVQGRERQQFDLAMWGWSGRAWALPLWHDIQFLAAPLASDSLQIPCDTTHREFFDNGLLLLRASSSTDAEVLEVGEVTPGVIYLKRPTTRNWPRGTRVYPALPAELREMPVLTRVTDRASATTVAFRATMLVAGAEAAPATLYRGWPVLEQRPEESEDLTSSMQRLLRELDNQTAVPARTDTAGQALVVQMHRFVPYQRAAHAALRGLLYWLQGRRRALWVPTFADDVTLAATVGAFSTSMTVANIGYARYGGRHGRRDLRIERRNGTVHHIRVLGATPIDDATEALQLDGSLGTTLEPAEVRRISWLQLCRLDHDQVEFLHERDTGGIGKCQLIFRGVKDDV